ncbi:MAG: ATP-binding cassette domain-containing protein, partial [Clostridia bacterium]|nr:ATP-binding cassette domain-containing protein [Clostridia bacterium]
MQVTLEHVTHTYQPGSPFQATAIRDVNVTIREGEFLALIGHTGSGKSTLAQHI